MCGKVVHIDTVISQLKNKGWGYYQESWGLILDWRNIKTQCGILQKGYPDWDFSCLVNTNGTCFQIIYKVDIFPQKRWQSYPGQRGRTEAKRTNTGPMKELLGITLFVSYIVGVCLYTEHNFKCRHFFKCWVWDNAGFDLNYSCLRLTKQIANLIDIFDLFTRTETLDAHISHWPACLHWAAGLGVIRCRGSLSGAGSYAWVSCFCDGSPKHQFIVIDDGSA